MHFIPVSEAAAMTALYRQNRENILQAPYQGQNILPLSETFERSAFDTVLAKDGCTAIRIYYSMDEDYQVHAVVVGVNANNDDLLPASSLTEEEEEDAVFERAIRCPDICPNASDLNT